MPLDDLKDFQNYCSELFEIIDLICSVNAEIWDIKHNTKTDCSLLGDIRENGW